MQCDVQKKTMVSGKKKDKDTVMGTPMGKVMHWYMQKE